MDSLPNFNKSVSTASTEVIDSNDNSEKSTLIETKLTISTNNSKIEVGSKIVVPLAGNILCATSAMKPWIDLVEKLATKY